MDLQSAVALSTLPRISSSRAAAVFKELRATDPDVTLEQVISASCAGVDIDCAAVADAARRFADDLLSRAPAAGIIAVPTDDPAYPALLRAIVDPPPVLWIKGAVAAVNAPAIAIVGSRAATPYALEVAARLAGELADRGLTVVSGLARGADGAAHRGCLAAGGATIAVLGCGPDIIYPAEHKALAVSLCEHGALVSELGPGAPPLQEHFPRRNRLISGISLAVVVVEASERSGSLITARWALEQGRDVMAVPGSVLSGRNRGSHALLKDGATVVESANDILEELGWPVAGAGPLPAVNPLKSGGLLDRMAVGEAYDLDALAALFGVPGPRLLARLTEWELQGRLARVAGGRFQRPFSGPCAKGVT